MDEKHNCWNCENKRSVPGECHIGCVNPDPEMEGHDLGIRNGWFNYPELFDPVWMKKECSNFKQWQLVQKRRKKQKCNDNNKV